MGFSKMVLAALSAAGLAACAKPAKPVPDAPPQPHLDAASQVGVSTAGVVGRTLNAPGNYLRGMAGNIEKAKQAAAEANKKAEEGMNLGSGYTGGK